MRLAVLVFPGDRDGFGAVTRLSGERAIEVRSGDAQLPHCDAVVVVGDGQPAGGAARADAVNSTAMRALRLYASAGGPVLGIFGGFSLLCRAGLLPGALIARPRAPATSVHVRIEGRPTPFTAAIPAGRVLRLCRQAAALSYVTPDVAELEERGQIVFRYTDAAGGVLYDQDACGSIAGISNARGNVVALLPDAVAASPAGRDSGDARQIFVALRRHLRPA